MPARFSNDPRTVLTLDAGGTNLKFSAIRANQLIAGPITLPTEADRLDRCLANIITGFERLRESLPEPPVAISFAFPGPADYPAGIIANVGNLPAFRGGVALGPVLEDRFHLPVFVNNDGDLFTYGEAIAGFLPYVNSLLEQAGSPRRYRNLFGVTLGTGLGGGIVCNGELVIGDNSAAGEAWLLRNRLDPDSNAEEGASIRAVRRVYASFEDAPDPETIFEIGMGRVPGNQQAAREAFRQLGQVVGDVLAQALTLIDGLAVIGGGIAAAHPLYMPALLDALNGSFSATGHPRLVARAYNIEDPAFLRGDLRSITVPGSERQVRYDPCPRTAIGISRLGTSQAVAIGAYAFALNRLDQSRLR